MSHHPDDTFVSLPDAAATPASAPGFAPGVRFDDYELIEKLGQGGMGEIWRAKDIQGKRDVAVKFVSREAGNADEQVERVETMFAQVHGLQHEHICPHYAMKSTPGFGTYLVMKYIPGEPLTKFASAVRREHGEFPLKTLLGILRQVAAALDYAHKNNVVHRDVKPGNIMVVGDPKTPEVTDVQLIDFDLAVTFLPTITQHEQPSLSVSGTRPYMAPEQWRGQKQDAATDQYSLAVTVYKLLLGEFPFDSDDVEALRLCVLNEPPAPIPGQPAAVNAAVQRALAKERKDRFPSCREFVAAMEKPPIPVSPQPIAPPKPVIQSPPPPPISTPLPPEEITVRLGLSEDRKYASPKADITDAELARLAEFPQLQLLNLGGRRQITDAGLAHLAGLTELQSLYLGECNKITDAGLKHLAKLTKLQKLYLVGCDKITDAGITHLAEMTALQILNLAGCNQVTDAGLNYLGSRIRLQGLVLPNGLRETYLPTNEVIDWQKFLQELSVPPSTPASSPPPKEPPKPAAPSPSIFAPPPQPKELPSAETMAQRLGLSVDRKTARPRADIMDHELAWLKASATLQKQLLSLDLSDCKQITNAGLAHLTGMTQLQELNVSNVPKINNEELRKLKESLPKCDILTNYNTVLAVVFAGILGAVIGGLFRGGFWSGMFVGGLAGYIIGGLFDQSYRSRISRPFVTAACVAGLLIFYFLGYTSTSSVKPTPSAGPKPVFVSAPAKQEIDDLFIEEETKKPEVVKPAPKPVPAEEIKKPEVSEPAPEITPVEETEEPEVSEPAPEIVPEKEPKKPEVWKPSPKLTRCFWFSDNETSALRIPSVTITDDDLAYLIQLPQLQTLCLSGCNEITDNGLAHLVGMTQLLSLDLSNCRFIADDGLAHLAGMTQLQSLNIGFCKLITDEGLAHLAGLTQLQSLVFYGSELVTDEGLAHLAGMTQLQSLTIGGKLITDKGLAHLAGLTQLQSLTIGGKYTTDEGLAHLAGLTQLQSLNLAFGQITDKGLVHLREMKQLQKLNMYCCRSVTDAGLEHLQELVQLQDLNLAGCPITDQGLPYLYGLKELQTLNIKGHSKRTTITIAGIQKLKKALPKCKIEWE